MSAGITFDDSLWPLLISRFRGTVSDASFENYLVQGAAYLRRGELYVSVLDMGKLSLPTSSQRQRQLEWLRDKKQAMREQVIGCAFLLDSPIIRLTLSTIFHVVPLPSPYVAVPDMLSGAHWASERLREHGLLAASLRVQAAFGLAPSWDAAQTP